MRGAPLLVMLVDDHQVDRDGIKLLLQPVEEVVCAEAAAHLGRHTTLAGSH